MPQTTAKRRRRPPGAYRTEGGIKSRPVCLSTSRGDTKLSPAEAVALAVELLVAAGRADPAAPAAADPSIILPLAERCYAQSELLTACSVRKE